MPWRLTSVEARPNGWFLAKAGWEPWHPQAPRPTYHYFGYAQRPREAVERALAEAAADPNWLNPRVENLPLAEDSSQPTLDNLHRLGEIEEQLRALSGAYGHAACLAPTAQVTVQVNGNGFTAQAQHCAEFAKATARNLLEEAARLGVLVPTCDEWAKGAIEDHRC